MKEFALNKIQLTDEFWQGYQELVRKETIPYQYQVLNDEIDVDVQAEREDPNLPAGKSHALANFRIAAGQMGLISIKSIEKRAAKGRIKSPNRFILQKFFRKLFAKD